MVINYYKIFLTVGGNMQIDMHYYGTYAMAVAAGIPKNDAKVIAYAAQFVDDSTRYDSGTHSDMGLLFGITTAHHPVQSFVKHKTDHAGTKEEQRKIWVPFHFYPGGVGNSFEEKIICVKDGKIVNEMLDNHISMAVQKDFRFELLGICAHVYQDTFSHYGFSGLSSDYNLIAGGSIEIIEDEPLTLLDKIKDKFEIFIGRLADAGSDSLGHAGGATYPDQPFLHWACTFDKNRPKNGKRSDRNNPKTFYESLEKLHTYFSKFAKVYYTDSKPKSFTEMKDVLEKIINTEGEEDVRAKAWKESGLVDGIPNYVPENWENEKKSFDKLATSTEGIKSNAYRFHQAAAYHRYYTLKDLLPKHGIAVY